MLINYALMRGMNEKDWEKFKKCRYNNKRLIENSRGVNITIWEVDNNL